jgi:hypothetical protein
MSRMDVRVWFVLGNRWGMGIAVFGFFLVRIDLHEPFEGVVSILSRTLVIREDRLIFRELGVNRLCQSVLAREVHNSRVQFNVKPTRLPASSLLQHVNLAMEPIDRSIMLKSLSLALRGTLFEDRWRLPIYCFRVRVRVGAGSSVGFLCQCIFCHQFILIRNKIVPS